MLLLTQLLRILLTVIFTRHYRCCFRLQWALRSNIGIFFQIRFKSLSFTKLRYIFKPLLNFFWYCLFLPFSCLQNISSIQPGICFVYFVFQPLLWNVFFFHYICACLRLLSFFFLFCDLSFFPSSLSLSPSTQTHISKSRFVVWVLLVLFWLVFIVSPFSISLSLPFFSLFSFSHWLTFVGYVRVLATLIFNVFPPPDAHYIVGCWSKQFKFTL